MREPARVLCVFSTLDRGGAETMCMELYRHIDRQKVQFDFVKHTHGIGAYEEEIKSLGGQIYEAPRYRVYNEVGYRRWWKMHFDSHPEHLIVHGHYFTVSGVFLSEAKKANRITVGHSHCTEGIYSSNWRKKAEDFYLSKIGRYSDYAFACSRAAGKYVFGDGPFMVLNNAIETQKFAYSEKVRQKKRIELGLEDCLALGTVGRFNLQKNPEGIIEIFEAVHNENAKARLLWVGDGPLRAKAEALVREKGLVDTVSFLGVRSDVPALMQAMDVFVFPSFYEGLGIVAIEAQASGLPCFCSTNVPKEAKVTDLCEFFPLDQPVSWARAIIEASKAPRRDASAEVRAAGYDVADTSGWLQDFYLSIDAAI